MSVCAREIRTVVRQPCPVYLFSQTDESVDASFAWEKPSPSSDRFVSQHDVEVTGSLVVGWRFFLGIFGGGQSLGGIVAPESGQACLVQINCYQLGAGLYGASTAGGSLSIQEQGVLQEGTNWSLGVFGEGAWALGGISSIDASRQSIGFSGGKAEGAGAAAGLQLCANRIFNCTSGGAE